MRKIVFDFDGKILEVILEDDMGYYSILGICEGMVNEFIEIPEQYEEYDG